MTENGIVKQTAPKPQLAVGSGGLIPDSFEGLWRMAEMVASTGFAPSNMRNNPKECMVAMAHGLEVGLGPMQAVQNIAVINGRPSIWGDAMVGLVLGSGQLEDQSLTFEGKPYEDDYAAVYMCKRVGHSPTVRRYSVADAKRAKLWGKAGPWTQNPNRMLGIRPRAFALRDTFADVLGGLYMAEEWGVTRETFDPDRMQGRQVPTLETKIGSDETTDEPELELIDEEPERDPDTNEIIPNHIGKRDELFSGEGE